MIYVDDSGKPERVHRNNRFFCLSAVIVNECNWNEVNESVKRIKQHVEIKEIHTRNIYTREKEFQYLNRNPILSCWILENIFNTISKLDITLISSVIDKEEYFKIVQGDDVEYKAWMHLIERCDMEISDRRRISESNYDKGLIITDHHTSDNHDERIKDVIEYLRIYGSNHHTFNHIIEEPLFTISKWRNLVQIADAVAYCSVNCLLGDEFFLDQFKKIESKFRTSSSGMIKNYGFKIYP